LPRRFAPRNDEDDIHEQDFAPSMTTPDILSAEFVRASAMAMLAAARAGRLSSIALDESRLDAAADFVVETTRANYPTLDIPFHARWRHFRADGRDLWAELDAATAWADQRERVKAAYDLVIVSVLLDAGAGMGWRYVEPITRATASKSEGLGLASFTMFREGLFSADRGQPLRVDASKLSALTIGDLRRGFQVSASNPMVGLEGRLGLLHRLGDHLSATLEMPTTSRDIEAERPSMLADGFLDLIERGHVVSAPLMLRHVLIKFGGIWPERYGAVRFAGDAWFHPEGLEAEGVGRVVAFHKLSQWLTYSLIEPLIWAGHEVGDIGGLTGLPEYRNGGLLLDFGVLRLKDEADWGRRHEVSSPLVIEWRALTVALLDLLADKVRDRLGLTAEQLPLAKVLEGGTWAAGRRIARDRRADGGPPLAIVSDGTVF
jgi:hypothetical protein